MDKSQDDLGLELTQEIWEAAENLVSPRVATREEALSQLVTGDYGRKSPLIAYIIASRIADPDLEFRFHVAQAIGTILSPDSYGNLATEAVISQIQSVIVNLNKEQIVDLLAVADRYISAEREIVEIFKLSSCAGIIFSDIVNDQKISVSIRQQAIFYCGEVGFLDTIPALEGLIKRVDKRKLQDDESPKKKRARSEKFLYPFALAAINKLNS